MAKSVKQGGASRDGSNEANRIFEDAIRELVQVSRLLGDETRLRILFYLAQNQELHVTALCDRLGQSQPAVSHHLALLRVSGLIEARRLGVRFVWLYILFGFLIAISVTFPLFMIAREMRLARTPDASAAWRLTASDMIGLALVTAAVLWLGYVVLS